MPDIQEEKTEGADAPKTHTDAFGTERDATTGLPVQPPPPVEKPKEGEEGKKEEKKKEEGAGGAEADELEKNPIVIGLKTQIEKLSSDKGSMGKNLSDMRKILDDTKDEIKRLKEGGKPSVEPMFKDIKRVKDLTAAEQENMTDGEKTLMDQLADTREAMNKMIADSTTKATEEATKAEETRKASESATAFAKDIQTRAMKMSGNDVTVANAIIAEFNTFAGNDTLDEAGRDERLAKAAKLVPDYKPPAEQKSATGGKAAGAADKKDDPHGITKIVEETAAGRSGGKSFSL